MSTWVVLHRPVAGVYAGHLEEARRALLAQGRPPLSDDHLSQTLWAARALPVALDVLADTRAAAWPGSLSVVGVRVVRAPDGGAPVEGQLIAVGVHESGSDVVEVRFVPPAMADDADATSQMSAAVIRLRLNRDAADDNSDVALARFTHGGRGDDGGAP